MPVTCFTSFTFSYLAKARVLARSLRQHHHDWHLVAVICDREPSGFSFDLEDEDFDEVIWADQLFGNESLGWLFMHDVVELCTAVKGPVLRHLLERGERKVVYLDPDIAVFDGLDPLTELLDDVSVLLTPHQLEPDRSEQGIFDNEVGSLATGIFNLGFLGVNASDQARSFADWWAERLEKFCYDDRSVGLFVDQKWVNLALCFFEDIHIVRDPGYNVASWNLSNRTIEILEDGSIMANGYPLRFFHFTKLGPLGDAMTQRYAQGNFEVYELWFWYKRMVDRKRDPAISDDWWKFGQFSNGVAIPKEARLLYRWRSDLREAFPNPFNAEGDSFFAWLKATNEGGLREALESAD